jgi:hypothetical protein
LFADGIFRRLLLDFLGAEWNVFTARKNESLQAIGRFQMGKGTDMKRLANQRNLEHRYSAAKRQIGRKREG